MRENTGENNSKYGHFSHIAKLRKGRFPTVLTSNIYGETNLSSDIESKTWD